jgi:hypothetical protein
MAAAAAAAAKTPKAIDEGSTPGGVNSSYKEVKAVLEIPIVKKDYIGTNSYGKAVEVT